MQKSRGFPLPVLREKAGVRVFNARVTDRPHTKFLGAAEGMSPPSLSRTLRRRTDASLCLDVIAAHREDPTGSITVSQYPSSFPTPPPPSPYSMDFNYYAPAFDFLAPARRASVGMFVLAAFSLMCGACAGTVIGFVPIDRILEQLQQSGYPLPVPQGQFSPEQLIRFRLVIMSGLSVSAGNYVHCPGHLRAPRQKMGRNRRPGNLPPTAAVHAPQRAHGAAHRSEVAGHDSRNAGFGDPFGPAGPHRRVAVPDNPLRSATCRTTAADARADVAISTTAGSVCRV